MLHHDAVVAYCTCVGCGRECGNGCHHFVVNIGVRLEAQVDARLGCQLDGNHPVGARCSLWRNFLGHVTNSAFDICCGANLFAVGGGRENDVCLRRRLGDEGVDGNDVACAVDCATGQVGIGHIAQWVGAKQHEALNFSGGGKFEHVGGVGCTIFWREACGDCAAHVATAKHRQNFGVWRKVQDFAKCVHHRVGRLGQVHAANNNHCRTAVELFDNRSIEGGNCLSGFSWFHLQALPCILREASWARSELENAGRALLRGITHAKEQDGKFFFQVGREQNDCFCGSKIVDGCLRQRKDFGWKAVGELAVALIDAECVGKSGPGKRVFVGASGATDDANRLRRNGKCSAQHARGCIDCARP